MTINEKIEAALKTFEEKVETKTPEGKVFLIEQVRYAAYELLRISSKIRETVPLLRSKDWRTVHGIHQDLLSVGQQLGAILFSCNLRSSITDAIEQEYGIRYSALRICSRTIDNTDGKFVYVFYDPIETTHGDTYTLAKDGNMFFVSVADFSKRYHRA